MSREGAAIDPQTRTKSTNSKCEIKTDKEINKISPKKGWEGFLVI